MLYTEYDLICCTGILLQHDILHGDSITQDCQAIPVHQQLPVIESDCCTLIEIFVYIRNIYSVTKNLRKIRVISFTENHAEGK